MIQLIAFIQILIQIITIPLYLLGFYLLYYMIFEDFKLGFMLIFANAVFGWLIVFIDNGLTLYRLRLRFTPLAKLKRRRLKNHSKMQTSSKAIE